MKNRVFLFMRSILSYLVQRWPALRKIMLLTKPKDTMDFEYSAKWYDEAYHLGRLELDKKTFDEINKKYENAGYRSRLESVLSKVSIPDEPIHWLEVGCHIGLTAYWVASRYPKALMYMFDFSEQSILWCKKNFPYRDRSTIWQGSVEYIHADHNDLFEFFDYSTCIDVTEHLPAPVYEKLIDELWRVIKPGGYLIVMQGNSPNVEHIHVLDEKELMDDFVRRGFVLQRHLPYRHYLFYKPLGN